jgi:hypothetical protein
LDKFKQLPGWGKPGVKRGWILADWQTAWLGKAWVKLGELYRSGLDESWIKLG